MKVYRIYTCTQWETSGQHLPLLPLDIKDGYIHLSTHDSIIPTANRYFSSESEIIVLCFDGTLFGTALKMEYVAQRNSSFPHLYAPVLLKKDILSIHHLKNSNEGFLWPREA